MNLPDLKRVALGHYKGSYCGEDFDVKKSGKEWHLHHKGRVWRERSRDEAVRSFVFQQDIDAIELPLAVDDVLRSLAERVRVATSKIDPSDIEAKDKLVSLKSSLESIDTMLRCTVPQFLRKLQEFEQRAAPVSAQKELT